MLIYPNENGRKIRGTHLILVTCAHCRAYLVTYQKVGKGDLVKMYLQRIVESSINFANIPRTIFCPNCQEIIGNLYYDTNEKLPIYRLKPGSIHKKRIKNG